MAWSQTSGEHPPPASRQDVVAYPEDKSETGARHSTPRMATVMARNHNHAGFDVPLQHGPGEVALDRLTREEIPGSSRALPLDLSCYLAIRKTA